MSDRDALTEDLAARRLAQTEFSLPLVLEAGAGTGKTTTLVARIVVWCLGPGWERAAGDLRRRTPSGAPEPTVDQIAARVVRGLVAITFTEAAAAEMATRVGRTLTALASDPTAPEGLFEDLLPDVGARSSRARALVSVLDRLVVRTIHAFCRRLLASHPIEAGLHPRIEVDADETLVAEVVREEIEGALHVAYGDPGEPAFLALADRGIGPREIADAVERLAVAGVCADAVAREGFTPERGRALRDELAARIDAFFERGGRALLTLTGAPAVSEAVAGLSRARARLEALAESSEAVTESLLAVVREDAARRLDVLAKWTNDDFGKKAEAALGADRPAVVAAATVLHELVSHLADVDVPLFECARAAIGPLLGQVDAALRRKGILTFEGILRDTARLLESRPEIAAQERARIDQLLVDEFQDTNPVQCAVLRALALQGPVAERPGLFLVGDPKQSIFGWRGADLRAYDDFLDEVGRERVQHLRVNFRSAPVILDEVARLVAPVMREERGVQPAFQPLTPSEKTRNEAGFRDDRRAAVEHWVSWDAVDGAPARKTRIARALEIEASALAADLLALRGRHGVAWRDVALLLRSLTQVDGYLTALREAAIPFEVAKERTYYRRREVIEAAALVRCVIDPNDTLALVTWLRSVSVGVPDAALIPLWARRLPERLARLRRPSAAALAELDEIVRGGASALPDDVPGLERVAGWDVALRAGIESIARLRASFEDDPADVFVEQLRVATGIEVLEASRHLGAYRLANLDRFFGEVAHALAEERDPSALLRRLRADVLEGRETTHGIARESTVDAVQVLSIHGAKGLDFEHVYVLQLHKAPGRAAWWDAPQADWTDLDGEVLLRLFKAPGPRDHLWKRAEARRLEAERRRELYVATTRAKRRLVLAGLRAQVDRGSLAALLASRAGGATDLKALWDAAAASPEKRHVDASDVRWVFPALAPDAPPVAAAPPPPAEDAAALAQADGQRLQRARIEAERRAARPLLAPASAAGHEALAERREGDEPRSDGADPPMPSAAAADADPPDRAEALAIGTAVHRALEAADRWLDARPTDVLTDALRGDLGALLPADRVDDAARRAGAILADFQRGPLAVRLRALGARGAIVARELPFLAEPDPSDADAPIGAVVGAIDLLYRDEGGYVVADYKTDVVVSQADVSAKVDAYRGQGRAYARAVQRFFGLERPPRFELWFLRTDLDPVTVSD